MGAGARRRVEAYWSRVFPVAPGEDGGALVVPHGALLHGYPGLYCLVRGRHVRVSAPPERVAEVRSWPLRAERVASPEWWQERLPGWTVLGPSVHSYTSRPVRVRSARVPLTVAEATPASLARLQEALSAEDWAEAGFDRDDVGAAWVGTDPAGAVLGGANLTVFDGCHSDVGVATAPGARGQGVAAVLAATATAWAVDHHGLARWRALETNVPSRRLAVTLGFEDHGTQLAARPA